MSYDLLKIVASASLGNVSTGADAVFPQWTGPDPIMVHVQGILCASLAASLLAAFLPMLCKQWLNRYALVDTRESIINRSRRRQRRLNGVHNWRFNIIVESVLLLLQAALLLLGCALAGYLFSTTKIIASIFIGFAAFGVLFYFFVVSAAGLSYDCPFQTPISQLTRSWIRWDNQNTRYIRRALKWLGRIFSQKKRSRLRSSSLNKFGAFDGRVFGDHIEVPMANQPHPLFNRDTDWMGYLFDSYCITWMLEMYTETDVIMAILRFIPEVVWHASIRTNPLERVYDTLVQCFDHSSGDPIVIPKLKAKAYLAAKAFLHLTIQRKYIGGECNADVFKSISDRHLPMGSQTNEGDSDLTSTLGIIDCVFGGSEPMDWQHFSFTATHHAWMGHILLYREWGILGDRQLASDDIKQFVCHSFRSEPSPGPPIIADCWFIISLILEIPLHVDDLSTVDKRHVDVRYSFRVLMLTLVFKL
jgi:hypothetical protein